MHVLSEAKRVQPCVVFVPHIDAWWEDSEYTVLRSALLSFLQDLDPSFPMLLFATADRPTVSPAHHLSKHFPAVVECTVPTKVFSHSRLLLPLKQPISHTRSNFIVGRKRGFFCIYTSRLGEGSTPSEKATSIEGAG